MIDNFYNTQEVNPGYVSSKNIDIVQTNLLTTENQVDEKTEIIVQSEKKKNQKKFN